MELAIVNNNQVDVQGMELLEKNSLQDGVQYLFKADNNFGASVVQHSFSYGGYKGLWELAVLKFDNNNKWDITYDTHITNDVLGHLNEDDVVKILKDIVNL